MNKIDILKSELDLIEFPYVEISVVHGDFLEILSKAMYLEPHENKDPLWGVILSNEAKIDQPHEIIDYFKSSYCDGKKNFAFRNNGTDNFKIISFDKNMLDLELLKVCESKTACSITKQGDILKIYYDGRIYLCKNRNWKIFDRIDENIKIIKKHYPDINAQFLKDILGFSFYELSINNIGATIILWFDEKFETEFSSLPDSMQLDFNSIKHKELLKNYLRNNDGAVVINQNCMVIGGQAHLTFSDDSRKYINLSDKGTRHNSAARFSFDNSKSIVITISEDGPVSVFSEGLNITKLTYFDPYSQNRMIHEIARENDGCTEEEDLRVQCPTCGKYYDVNVLIVYGWKEPERERCRICGDIVHSQKCFSIESNLVKIIK